jgi:hypothetical protein
MTSKLRWVPVFAAGLAVSGGIAVATTTGGERIHACVGPTGLVRVVDDGACRRMETPLTWNKRGVRGPRGYAGAQGPAGPAGGEPGPAGPRGIPGGATSLERTADAAEFSSPIAEEDVDSPGAMTVDVPEGALVSIASSADARLVTSCRSVIGFVSVVDSDKPGVYLSDAGVTTSPQWATEQGAEQSPAPAFLAGLQAHHAHAPLDPLPDVDPTVPGSDPGLPPFGFVNSWMSPYFIVSPGVHRFKFVHDIENWSETPCTDATLYSRDRRMWVSVMTPTEGASR